MTTPADPIDDLDGMIAILRSRDLKIAEFHAMQVRVADALQRLRAERDAYNEKFQSECSKHDKTTRQRREAEAERDAMRECVLAADVMRAGYSVMWGERPTSTLDAYDAARAKVKP